MKNVAVMPMVRVVLALVVASITRAGAAPVLCKKKSGAVVVRDPACRKKETQLDLAQFGVMPPDSPDQVRAKFFAGTACPGNDPADVMVKVGDLCVDVYEASVWSAPTGGTQYGVGPLGYPCGPEGNDCNNIFARSVAGVRPSVNLTWFQAQQACRNSGKRLLTNAEWQMAAAGTPDPGMAGNGVTTCNTATGSAVNTGSTGDCVSIAGVRDMVGNVNEWVADWGDQNTGTCTDSTAAFGFAGGDEICLGGNGNSGMPGALVRGDSSVNLTFAGVFSALGIFSPSHPLPSVGFRCTR